MKYTHPYIEQWNRLVRLRRKLDEYSEASDDNFEEALDAFTSFIIQCYHLRDWLIKSGYSQISIDHAIQNDTYLSLCRDLANTQKHQKIDRYTPKNSFVENDFGISTPISRSYDPIKQQSFFGVMVWEFGLPVNILEIANRCLESWQAIIGDPHFRIPGL